MTNSLRYFKFFSFGGNYVHHMIYNLRNYRLFAPSLDKLNDPFEGMWYGCNVGMVFPERDDEMYGSLRRKGILCFCSSIEENFPCTPNSILMWAHYSDSNRGFCVEFNESIFSIESPRFGHASIEYRQKLPYKESDFQDGELAEKDKRRILFWKSNLWKYEHEIRICCDQANEYVQLPKTSINAIYCGSNISKENLNLLYSIAQENGWDIFKLRPSNLTYSFNLFPVTTCNTIYTSLKN